MAEGDDIEQSLAVVREALVPPVGTQERVLSQVASRRALEAAAARASGGRGMRTLATTVLVGAGFATGYWLGQHPSDVALDSAVPPGTLVAFEHSQPASSQAVPSAASPAAPPSSPPALEPARSLASDAEKTATTGANPRAASTDASRAVPARRARPAVARPLDELTLLSRAERALRAGEAALALTFLDELDRNQQRSALLEERVAARLLADCMLKGAGAVERAKQFLREHPVSVYSDRLQSTCAIGAAGDGAHPEKNGSAAVEP